MESTERAVVRLTEPHTEWTEAGATEWPPLLVWLEESVTSMVKRGGAGSNGSGIPIDFEALRLLDDVKESTALIREALFLRRKTGDLIADVREAWTVTRQARARGEVDDGQWERITAEIESWVTRIEAEQAQRPRKMELTVPCPRCGYRWFQEDGERKSAIVIEYADGRAPVAECRVPDCEALWAGWRQIHQLGFTVGADMSVDVLKACGIDLGFEITSV